MDLLDKPYPEHLLARYLNMDIKYTGISNSINSKLNHVDPLTSQTVAQNSLCQSRTFFLISPLPATPQSITKADPLTSRIVPDPSYPLHWHRPPACPPGLMVLLLIQLILFPP